MISVIIPAKNEQNNIGHLIQEIDRALKSIAEFEVVVTDDGSTDQTAQEAIAVAKQLNCSLQIVTHPQSRGQSTAIHSAILFARGSLIVTLDADGQNDPKDIPAMLQKAQQMTAPHFCIAGFRWQRKDTPWKRFQSKFANRIRQAFLHDGVPDSGCGLKVFPRQTFLALPYFDHMHRFLPALIKRLGGEIEIHKVSHRDRMQGKSKYTAWNRAWVGFVDLFGVCWLLNRNKYTKPIQTFESTRQPLHHDSKQVIDAA